MFAREEMVDVQQVINHTERQHSPISALDDQTLRPKSYRHHRQRGETEFTSQKRDEEKKWQ